MAQIVIKITDTADIYQSVTVQVGQTLLAAAADNGGIRIDPDMSAIDADGLYDALDTLVQVADRYPVYAYIDTRDVQHQWLDQAMARLGGTYTAIDGRYIRRDIF